MMRGGVFSAETCHAEQSSFLGQPSSLALWLTRRSGLDTIREILATIGHF